MVLLDALGKISAKPPRFTWILVVSGPVRLKVLKGVSIWGQGVAASKPDLFQFRKVVPTPANIPLLRALRSLLDGSWGVLRGSWGVLAVVPN